jgi:hypothetical protein
MNAGIIQEIDREHDQVVDAERLIEAVRGSRAALVLYELRPWLPRPDAIDDGDLLATTRQS